MKDRIISLMKHMGMSQKVFAAEICISEGALSSIFSGRTKPTLNTVNNIHERFPEVNVGWLIDGKGEMFTPSGQSSVQADANDGGHINVSSLAAGIPIQTGFMEPLSGTPQGPPQNSFPATETKSFDIPMRRIAEIRVFYDDGTFETFPAKS